MLMVIFVVLLLSLGQTNAQETTYGDYGGANNSNISCIRKYRDLEAYVLNNEDLMDNLTETFYKTGKSSTDFVKITYKFKVLSLLTNIDKNISNDTGTLYDDDDDDEPQYACVDDQKLFIWSTSALNLLGPEPLFWMTLFAVHVPENKLIVQLPCLCDTAYDDLLSRLSYLVSKDKQKYN